METLSAKYILVVTAAIIAGNAAHRWLIRPLIVNAGLISS